MIVWVAESITDYIAERTWRNLAQDIEHDVRMEAYQHVQELELAHFEDRSVGGLVRSSTTTSTSSSASSTSVPTR